VIVEFWHSTCGSGAFIIQQICLMVLRSHCLWFGLRAELKRTFWSGRQLAMLILCSQPGQIKSRGISHQALARGSNMKSDTKRGKFRI